METIRRSYIGFYHIIGSLKDALLLQCIISSCWYLITRANESPIFNATPINLTYYTDETATLKCSVSNLGSSKVIWKREDDSHVLTVGKFVFVSESEYSLKQIPYKDEWNLIIEKVQPRHAGLYECQISTKTDKHRYVNLIVIDEPGSDRRYINITGPSRRMKGDRVKLTCNVSGSRTTPKQIRWYLNGSLLVNGQDSNIRIITYQRSDVFSLFSELDIGRVNIYNVGNYMCRAILNNGIKEANHNLFLDASNADSKQSKRGTLTESIGPESIFEDSNNPSLSVNADYIIMYSLWTLLFCLSAFILV